MDGFAASAFAPEGFAFWELRRISLVNWSFVLWQDLEVRGAIALTGPNGSCKSSLVDAIQTVLTGGHGQVLRLNSRASQDKDGASGHRTLREYVLGAADDLGNGLSMQRDSAICYLMLGFRHKDGREATAGVCITATKDEPGFDFAARFVAEGRMLSCADVADVGADARGRYCDAHHWSAVRARLQRDDGLANLEVLPGAELFVRHLLRALGPRDVVSHAKFLKNVRSSISFRGTANVNEFIRTHILDDYDLNLRSLRQSIARHRTLQDEIAALNQRIERASRIRARAAKVPVRERSVANHELSRSHGFLHLGAVALADARQELERTEAALETVRQSLPALVRAKTDAKTRSGALQDELARSSTTLEIARLEADIGNRQTRVAELSPVVASAGKAAANAVLVEPIVDRYDRGAAARLREIAKERLTGEALVRRLHASPAWKAFPKVGEAASRSYAEAEAEAARARQELAALREELDAARKGKRLLSNETRELVALLRSNRIEARPLCDLVTDVDQEWHEAVEAILGRSCEALIVAPEDYRDALRVSRLPSAPKVPLVNTTKTEGTRPARRGSLATVVRAADSHARAFIDYKLGAVAMVETEAELAREDSAATRDLMYASGRICVRLDRPRALRLGAFSAGEACDRVEREIAVAEAGLRAREERLGQAAAAMRSLLGVADALAAIDPEALEEAVEGIRGATADIEEMRGAIARLREAPDSVRLREDLARATAEAERAEAAHMEAFGREQRLVASATKEREAVEAKALAVEAQRRDAMDRAHRLERLGGTLPEDLLWNLGEAVPPAPRLDIAKLRVEVDEAAATGSDGRRTLDGKPPMKDLLEDFLPYLIRYNSNRLATEKTSTVRDLAEYMGNHGIARPEFMATGDEEAFPPAAAWLEDEIGSLTSNELTRRERDAADAYALVVENFRNDFVGKMGSAFDGIDARLRELNRHLERRCFHGLTYRFTKNQSNAYRDMIALVKAARTDSFDLSDASTLGALDERSTAGLKRLMQVAQDPTVPLEELENPKLYFEFDIALLQSGVEIATVSKRSGYGSGGQVQVPGYVTISAAIAATAYPGRAGTDGGIALAVFDEVFDKTDTEHSGKAVQFMRDVGLQPFLSAPDEKRTTLFQMCDTMIGTHRSGAVVTFDVQYPTRHAHDAFAAENPALYGLDGFRARLPAALDAAGVAAE
jgi:uncharacterized protein YPO0396